MKRLFKKIPYNRLVAIVILLFTSIPCIILGVIYLQSERNTQKQSILSEYYTYADATATMASKTLASLESKMGYLMFDFEIHSHLSEINDLSLSQAIDLVHEINDAISIISLDNSSVTARWYPTLSTTSYGNYCHTLNVLAAEFPAGSDDPGYQEILALKDNQRLWKFRKVSRGSFQNGTPDDRLCLYSRFTILGHSAFFLEISIPTADLFVPLENPLPLGSLLALRLGQNDSYEYVILSSPLGSADSTSLLTQYGQNGNLADYEVIESPIAKTHHGKVLLLLPKSYVDNLLWPAIFDILMLYLLIAAIILGTCYMTSYFLTRKIITSIKEIQKDIATVTTQTLEESPVPTDIQRICQQVKNLVQNAQDYCRKIDYYEKESIRTELELLQMRFNPHLLYNTLAAVNHQTKEQKTRAAVVSLANYYRIVLNNGQIIIRMADEIEMVKEYLSVMKFTYCLADITYEFDIDEEILQYSVIKHVIQPIVENAIHHGLRPLKGNGILRICGKAEDDCLLIQVVDNGIGMSAEETENLLKEPAKDLRGGYGIYNVQSRLQLHYGKEYGLTIHSKEGKGTCVTMRIPKIME